MKNLPKATPKFDIINSGKFALPVLLVLMAVLASCTPGPKMAFSVEGCAAEMDPYSKPEAGLTSAEWVSDTELVVMGFVKTNCAGTKITGSYQLKNEELLLSYQVKAAGAVTSCNCAHKFLYRFTGLKHKDFTISLISPNGEKMTLQPTKTPDDSMGGAELKITDIVAKILTANEWEGKQVTLVGYYRGWDLLKEANQGPPVTRSDWVIKDNSGAIYVQAKNVEFEGQEQILSGDKISPDKKEFTDHIVQVIGIVRMTQKNQSYIEPLKIILLK